MPDLEIRINLDNEAFRDAFDHRPDIPEIARVLARAVELIAICGNGPHALLDINGNTVGHAEIRDTQPTATEPRADDATDIIQSALWAISERRRHAADAGEPVAFDAEDLDILEALLRSSPAASNPARVLATPPDEDGAP